MLRALLDLLAPSLCDGCGVRAAPPWCATCDTHAVAARPEQPCPRCAGPEVSGHACWSAGTPLDGLVALTAWHDPVARAVLRAKLEGRTEVFSALGRRLAPLVPPDGPVVVVPVPTLPRRVRSRGGDHTRALATAVASARGDPVVRALRVGREVVDRGRAAAAGRSAMPADAFVATRHAAALGGRTVLLVDDLVTTGGTLAAAGRAVRGAGAARVCAAVVARAGRHELGG